MKESHLTHSADDRTSIRAVMVGLCLPVLFGIGAWFAVMDGVGLIPFFAATPTALLAAAIVFRSPSPLVVAPILSTMAALLTFESFIVRPTEADACEIVLGLAWLLGFFAMLVWPWPLVQNRLNPPTEYVKYLVFRAAIASLICCLQSGFTWSAGFRPEDRFTRITPDQTEIWMLSFLIPIFLGAVAGLVIGFCVLAYRRIRNRFFFTGAVSQRLN